MTLTLAAAVCSAVTSFMFYRAGRRAQAAARAHQEKALEAVELAVAHHEATLELIQDHRAAIAEWAL